MLNPQLEGTVPPTPSQGPVQDPLTPTDLDNQQVETSSFLFGDTVKLQWLKWNGSLPNGAVSVYNDYVDRIDYVCKFSCESGFYSPSKGTYCYYPLDRIEHKATEFELLVNKDNFEFLEWKEDSDGSMPTNAVRTCTQQDRTVYVGKNEYGLGKLEPIHKAYFYLPWEGEEYRYWYRSRQVLIITIDTYTQHISHVEYATDKAKMVHYPPETLRESTVTNNECQTVSKTVTISRTTTKEHTWNWGLSATVGSKTTIKTGIPFLAEGGVELSFELTGHFSKGGTHAEDDSHSVSVEVNVPPNHSCTVRMEGRKMTTVIPYTARLSRTYRDGETQWTSISGKYNGVQIGDIRTVIDRCQALSLTEADVLTTCKISPIRSHFTHPGPFLFTYFLTFMYIFDFIFEIVDQQFSK